ncbi:uncharacterized protein LOC108951345 [Musa acuminata AAA Group]|uniref:uncharacterized protein LOC108951345 n=1 Tax=Musa acuminata AAA Group TaxID=214697 RepID=UPI0031D2ADA4
MQTEAPVGVVLDGGGLMALSCGHDGGVGAVDGGVRRYATHDPRQNHQRRQHRQLQHQPQIGTVAHLIAGGVAAAVSKTCTAPLAPLTILFQMSACDCLVEGGWNNSCIRHISIGSCRTRPSAQDFKYITNLSLENVQTNAMYYRGISHALYAICRGEGMRGLYKGLGPTLLVSDLF